MDKKKMASPDLGSIEVQEINRGTVLMKGVLAAGALYGAASAGPLVRRAFASSSSSDVDILNFALTLEYLEAAFYAEAADKVPDLPSDVSGYVDTFGMEEQEHVDALKSAIKGLGGKPVSAPKVDFGNALASTDSFLKVAQTFEDTGVSAYNGAAPMIKAPEVLASAGSIVQIEARHAALIRVRNGEPPAPEAFDSTMTAAEVQKAVQPFLAS